MSAMTTNPLDPDYCSLAELAYIDQQEATHAAILSGDLPDPYNLRLVDAVEQFGYLVRQAHGLEGDVFASLTCSEADALAKVFKQAGELDAARLVIDEHSLGDDEGDRHYERRVSLFVDDIVLSDAFNAENTGWIFDAVLGLNAMPGEFLDATERSTLVEQVRARESDADSGVDEPWYTAGGELFHTTQTYVTAKRAAQPPAGSPTFTPAATPPPYHHGATPGL
jgi:hypothetical protein